MPSILADLTAEYLSSIEPPADDLLEEMEAHARRDSIPIASREVATLQRILALATDADRALEFGTAIGYSTIQVARTGCEVVTTEVDAERIAAAREYAERDGVATRIEIHERPALDALDDVEGPFDLVFLDAVKTEYPAYLERSLPMLRTGGVVVVDNALWDGEVPDAHATGDPADEATGTLLEFNADFVDHPALEAVVTPIDDGTGIAVKRK
ncbi:MAG: caffeoyl-CoA O-methyltransferase [Halobacteriales archaeon]|jgi:caffeoyl-CoA O-methyltransferase